MTDRKINFLRSTIVCLNCNFNCVFFSSASFFFILLRKQTIKIKKEKKQTCEWHWHCDTNTYNFYFNVSFEKEMKLPIIEFSVCNNLISDYFAIYDKVLWRFGFENFFSKWIFFSWAFSDSILFTFSSCFKVLYRFSTT